MAISPIGGNLESAISYFEKKIWKQLRTQSLMDQLASEKGDNVVHRVTDLKGTTWGKKAVLTMIPDDISYGVIGDNQLENRETSLTAYDQSITFDQFRRAIRNVGKMDDRSYWFKFAQQATDQLTYWANDVKDKLFMNVIAGVGFEYEVDGSLRGPSCEWSQNEFAGDVTAPSTRRHLRWDVGTTNTLVSGSSAVTSNVAATDLPTWNMFLDMRTELPLMRIKPIRGKFGSGNDLYIAIVNPRTMNVLKKDTTFQTNLREAMQRGDKNPVFAGANTWMVDGILLIEHRYGYSTLGAAPNNKWGGGNVDGARTIFLGAQAVGAIDMQAPRIVTEEFDYKNSVGIGMSFQAGFKKLVWPDTYAGGASEDAAIVCLDHAIPAGATNYTY